MVFLTVISIHSIISAIFGSVIDLFFSSLRVTFLAFSNIFWMLIVVYINSIVECVGFLLSFSKDLNFVI